MDTVYSAGATARRRGTAPHQRTAGKQAEQGVQRDGRKGWVMIVGCGGVGGVGCETWRGRMAPENNKVGAEEGPIPTTATTKKARLVKLCTLTTMTMHRKTNDFHG